MLDSRFWDGAEWVCKTVRHTYLSVAREFRVAWVSGVEAAQRDAADALAEKEAEEEVAEPQDFIIAGPEDLPAFHWNGGEVQSADFDDQPVLKCSVCPMGDNPSDCRMDCTHMRKYYRHLHGLAATDFAAPAFYWYGNPLAPAASTTAVEDPSGAGTPLLASEADSIKDVLAEHYLESLSDRRIVGCRCGLELGSRQQHWDHQADLIAGALKARTEAQK